MNEINMIINDFQQNIKDFYSRILSNFQKTFNVSICETLPKQIYVEKILPNTFIRPGAP